MALPFDREYLDLLWAGGDLSSEPPLGVPAEELMSVPPPPPSGALLESYDAPEWRDVSHPDIEARAWEEDFYGRLASPGGEEAHEAGHGMFVEPLLNIAAQAPGLMARSFGRRGGGELPPLTPDEERAALDAALMGVAGPVGRAGGKAWRWLTQTPGLTRPVPGGWRTAAGGPVHGAPAAGSGTAYDDLAELKARLDAPSEAPPAAYETLAAEPAAAAAPKSARVGMREAYKGIRAPRHAALEEGAYRGSGEYGKMRAKQSVHRDAVDSALTPEDVGVLKDYGRQFYPPGSSIFDKVDNVISKAPKREEAIDLWRGETVGAPGDRFQRADLEALKPGDVLDLDRPRSADSTLSNVAANWMQGPDKVLFRFADNRNSIPAGLYTGIMDEHIVPSGKYVVKGSYYDTTTSLAAPYGAAWRQEQPARLVIELAEPAPTPAPAPAPGRPAIKEAYAKARPEVVAPEKPRAGLTAEDRSEMAALARELEISPSHAPIPFNWYGTRPAFENRGFFEVPDYTPEAKKFRDRLVAYEKASSDPLKDTLAEEIDLVSSLGEFRRIKAEHGPLKQRDPRSPDVRVAEYEVGRLKDLQPGEWVRPDEAEALVDRLGKYPDKPMAEDVSDDINKLRNYRRWLKRGHEDYERGVLEFDADRELSAKMEIGEIGRWARALADDVDRRLAASPVADPQALPERAPAFSLLRDEETVLGPAPAPGRPALRAAYEAGKPEPVAPEPPPPTQTPAFRRWFGESKVVDEKGEPMVVYKGMWPYDYTKEIKTPTPGTPRPDWPVEDPGPLLDVINRPSEFPSFLPGEPGVEIAGFFGDAPTASRFAEGMQGTVYPVHLSFQKPYVIDAAGKHAGDVQFQKGGQDFRDSIRSGEYDSVIIKNTKDEGTIYVALKPTQIKSATGNVGTFDPKDPRIAYGIAGAAAAADED